ncbi:hypothetical protein D3C78_995180 [compost metagenome]
MQRVLQQLEIIGRCLFGQLDHHLARRDAELLEHLQGSAGLMAGFEQGFGGDVEKQLAWQPLLAEAAAGAVPAGDLQFAEAPGLAGHGEQGERGVQGGVGGASAEGLVTENASFRERNDGLEQAVQGPLSQN